MPPPKLVIWRRIAVAVSLAAVGLSGVAVGASPASAAADYSSVILASSPLAYWRLNEQPGSKTAVDDAGGRNGTYSSCVQLGRKGPINKDRDTAGFFGKPGCWMTFKPSSSYAGAYSVEAWVKPGSASKFYQTIFDTRGPDGEFSFDLVLEGTSFSGGQHLHIDVGDGQRWLTPGNGNIPFAFTPGQWYYIAATVSPADHQAVLYVNGTVLGSMSLQHYRRPPALFGPKHPITIGGDPLWDLIRGNPNPENFDGTIGQVAVYESVLTAGTVAAHYAAGAARGVSIGAVTALPIVSGDSWVIYKDRAKYSTAAISGWVTGAAAGQVAELLASKFPYKTGFRKAGATHALNGPTSPYIFRVRPTLATRYKVELLATAGASRPLLTSPVFTLYVASGGYFISENSCHRPICHLTARFRILVPPATFAREHHKTWYPYLGVVHADRLPKTLQLGAGNGRAVVGPKIGADGFNLTLTFAFSIGNGAYGWAFNFCDKDTESADGLGLPGHHLCGATHISRNLPYLG